MKPRYFAIALMVVVLVFRLPAQQQHSVDSLKNLLAHLPANDTTRVRVLSNLSFMLVEKTPLAALEYAQTALVLSQQLHDSLGQMLAFARLGHASRMLGNFTKAREYFTNELSIAEKAHNKQRTANALSSLGRVYVFTGDYAKALDYCLRALRVAEETGDKRSIILPTMNLAETYVHRQSYDEALPYFAKALQISEELADSTRMILILNNIGFALRQKGQYGESLRYLTRSEQLAEKYHNNYSLALSLNNIGEVYRLQGRYDAAIEYGLRALKIKETMGDKWSTAYTCNQLVLAFTAARRFSEAEQYANRALALTNEIQAKDIRRDVYFSLSIMADSAGKYKEALAYYRQYKAWYDSLFSENSSRSIANAREQYESEKKDKSIQLLQKDQSLHEAEIKRQRVVQWSLAAILAGAIIAAVWLGRLYQQKRKANSEILRQQAILQDQATEIELINTQLHETNIGLDTALHDLKTTQSQLVQSERMSAVGMLTAGVMHEINNPNAIAYSAISQTRTKIGEMTTYFLSLLDEESKHSNEVRKFHELSTDALSRLELAADGSHRVKTIVSNLQGFTKHQENDVLPGDWTKEIRGTVSLFQLQYQNVSVEATLPDTMSIHANFGELNQVILNLLVNAAQAGASHIHFHGELSETQATVSIADNGKGIAPEALPHIFEPFFSTKGVGNSGLGLSISKQIVERHGGTIRCESAIVKSLPNNLSAGTTFFLTLPVSLSEHQK